MNPHRRDLNETPTGVSKPGLTGFRFISLGFVISICCFWELAAAKAAQLKDPSAPITNCMGVDQAQHLSHSKDENDQRKAILEMSLCPGKEVVVFYRQTFLTRLQHQSLVIEALRKRNDSGIFEKESFDFLYTWVHSPQKQKSKEVTNQVLLALKSFAEKNKEVESSYSEIKARCVLWNACELLK